MVEPTTTQATATATNTTRTHGADSSREGRRESMNDGKASARGPAFATLQRLQSLADASPRVAQLQRLQAQANGVGQGLLQRKTPEEEQLLQGMFSSSPGLTSERQPASGAAPTATPNRTGLPDGLKSGIEALSGVAMDHVRVHYNSAKPAQLSAHAFAQGNDIHLAPGQDQHLPHEAWHIVQQAQGRVQPTLHLQDGVAVNDDPGLEREADQMGEQALARGT
jgi:hypothetical protein